MNRRDLLLALPALAASTALRAEVAPDLPLARDLRADALLVRERRIPFLVLFSLAHCPYCSEVRRSHLLPMLRDPAQARRAVIRQVNIGSDERIVGFDGAPTTHDAVARAHGVRAAPVVAFWDAQGRPIADSLSGMLLPDFYSAYLESALESATARLARHG
jgi:thioredoxin-related protein